MIDSFVPPSLTIDRTPTLYCAGAPNHNMTLPAKMTPCMWQNYMILGFMKIHKYFVRASPIWLFLGVRQLGRTKPSINEDSMCDNFQDLAVSMIFALKHVRKPTTGHGRTIWPFKNRPATLAFRASPLNHLTNQNGHVLETVTEGVRVTSETTSSF